MDVLIIPCPSCQHELRLPDLSLLGRFGRCPACQHRFVLEDPSEQTAATGEFVPTDLGHTLHDDAHQVAAEETAPMATGDSIPDSEGECETIPARIGRYEIKGRLGQGSMGDVYLAFDGQLHRDVALKVPKFSDDEKQGPVERFYREARLAATLSHPSICPVYDIGEVDDMLYIAMAYIEGRPLSDYISHDKPQPLPHIAKTICRVAMAVQEAHERGVLHRDLKPDNIMIDEHRKPVIMDFGLARRLFKEGEERLTHSGALVGSPAYMSPEQVEGDPAGITASSDIYSLGVVLYELMTGRRPFRGYVGAVMGKILHETPQPPSELRADVDPAIESICLRMLAKRPEDRYRSMDEVARVLASYLHPSEANTDQAMPTIDLAPFHAETAIDPPKPEQSAATSVRHAGEPSSTPKNTTTLRTARKLYRKHDYQNAIELLKQVPEADRDPDLISLLGQAQTKQSQAETLIAEINLNRRNRDYYAVCRDLAQLLELKPNHKRARQMLDELEQKGFSGAITELSMERQAAQWILKAGGSVDLLIDGETIQNFDSTQSLPETDFRVISCGLTNCESIDDHELANIAGLASLQNLALAHTSVSDAGLRHVGGFTGLTSLYLTGTAVVGSGLKYLESLPRLIKLDLTNTRLDDGGLAQFRPIESLEFLGLFGTPITDTSVEHLACFAGLTFLDLYDTRITQAGVNRLSKILPDCRINH